MTPRKHAQLSDAMTEGDVQRIQRLHSQSETLAYEVGRAAAAHGFDKSINPFEVPAANQCGMLALAWDEGWRDETDGKP